METVPINTRFLKYQKTYYLNTVPFNISHFEPLLGIDKPPKNKHTHIYTNLLNLCKSGASLSSRVKR